MKMYNGFVLGPTRRGKRDFLAVGIEKSAPPGSLKVKAGEAEANGATATPIYELGILFVGQIMRLPSRWPCSLVPNSTVPFDFRI